MTGKVLILGGYGNFGKRIASALIRHDVPVIIAGRSREKAQTLLKISNGFNRFGTAHGGMHMILRGKDKNGQLHERRWFIIAKNGDGPQIPCVPAILLAKQLACGEPLKTGAYPCVGMVTLDEYLAELTRFDISVH